MNTLEALHKIFDRPREVFAALKKERFWILATLAFLAVLLAHIALIDFAVYRAYTQYEPSAIEKERYEKIMEEYREEIEATQAAAQEDGAVFFGAPGSGTETTAVFVASPQISRYHLAIAFVSFLIALVLEVAYLKIVSAGMKLPFEVRDWIAFSVWSRIPAAALALVGVLLVLLVSGYQANVTNYEVFSIARWIPIPDRPDWGINFLHIDIYHLDATLLWIIALQTIGFREWSGKNVFASLVVVSLPTTVLYGLVLWLSTDGLGWTMAFYFL